MWSLAPGQAEYPIKTYSVELVAEEIAKAQEG